MKKQHLLIAAFIAAGAAGLLTYSLINSSHKNDDTQRQIDEIKRQLAEQKNQTNPANTQSTLLIGVTTQDGSALAKQRATHDVITEGYRLIATRKPDDARKAIDIFREGIDKV